MNDLIELENAYGAHNYHPLPVMLSRGQGCQVWDQAGNRYLDMMSAYSAVSHGHAHPKLVAVLTAQAKQLAVTSRAFYTDKLSLFLEKLCHLFQYDKALPMNTGAEAVETALKAARKWAYQCKGVPENEAEIIVCDGNFHGRTITIVGFSSETQYRQGFGPFPPGFKRIPYGDFSALKHAITPNTAAFLVEPIQGEGGIILPPPGYLKNCAELCAQHRVLLICDEIQTGLGRTGKLLACDHDGIHPDGLILGKALGGGLLPVSAFLANDEVMQVFTPGDHGSTFGGNPLAAAVALEALNLLESEQLISNAAEMGAYLQNELRKINTTAFREIRGRGLMVGLEIDPNFATARSICLELMKHGVLTKETHNTVVRLAPPLLITQHEIDFAITALKQVLHR